MLIAIVPLFPFFVWALYMNLYYMIGISAVITNTENIPMMPWLSFQLLVCPCDGKNLYYMIGISTVITNTENIPMMPWLSFQLLVCPCDGKNLYYMIGISAVITNTENIPMMPWLSFQLSVCPCDGNEPKLCGVWMDVLSCCNIMNNKAKGCIMNIVTDFNPKLFKQKEYLVESTCWEVGAEWLMSLLDFYEDHLWIVSMINLCFPMNTATYFQPKTI